MPRRSWVLVTVWTVVVGLLVSVVTFMVIDRLLPAEISIEPVPPGPITVEIVGAVATPGLVTVREGARLQDVVDAAGGLAPDAVLDDLNMAGLVHDGEQIVIPRASTAIPDDAAPQVSGAGTPASSLIDLNTATVSELDQLPGVGPVIAQRIVDFREFYGPFDSVDQLAEVEGISPAMVERIRPLVTVND